MFLWSAVPSFWRQSRRMYCFIVVSYLDSFILNLLRTFLLLSLGITTLVSSDGEELPLTNPLYPRQIGGVEKWLCALEYYMRKAVHKSVEEGSINNACATFKCLHSHTFFPFSSAVGLEQCAEMSNTLDFSWQLEIPAQVALTQSRLGM